MADKSPKADNLKSWHLPKTAWFVCCDFVNEARRNLASALVSAFAIILALTFRDLINDCIDSVIRKTNVETQLAKTAIITTIAILGIWFISRTLAVRDQIPISVDEIVAEAQ